MIWAHGDSAWDYATFGEGPCSSEDHVVVSREYFDKARATPAPNPPPPEEARPALSHC